MATTENIPPESSTKKGRFTVQFFTGGDATSSDPHLNEDKTMRNDDNENIEKELNDVETGGDNSTAQNKENLYLYEEDMKRMPRVATFLKTMMMSGTHTTYPSEREEKAAKMQPKRAKLGLMFGVYLPTIQHILGLLMFIRHAWIVGCSGLLESLLMVFICCLTTFVTSISLSAIATNGMVQSGGSYYMLSRNLGPECGGSIGICFYLANTVATCMYLLGAIEILLLYMAPQIAFFGDIHLNPWNNYRVYGTAFMIALTLIVAIGVKFIALFAPISLACVIVSVLSIIVGAVLATPESKDVWVCLLGDRLLASPHHGLNDTITEWCTKNITGDIWHRYCMDMNGTISCDQYFEDNNVHYMAAIPGITSGVITRNVFSEYMSHGEVSPGVAGNRAHGEIVSDMSTNFVLLCAIYFPSVTGILTGANMSGDLRDPQKSLPAGTILAQLSCSFIYILLVLIYGASIEGEVLRDKFGESVGGQLAAALLCWPNPWVVLVGAFASSIGAALQCLTSAPRLLQAIARDDIIPFLGFFKVTNCNGEPTRALLLSFVIAEIGVLVANIDLVAPVIDVFFLMCYLFVNLICALQTLLKTPNWRPRFKYYHWTLSVLGVLLNFALCIIAGWYYALSAFAIAVFIFKYIEYKGGEKEWGDGISGLTMSTAQRALLKIEDEPHTKNWRPQLLIFSKIELCQEQPIEHPQFFSLAAQLKAGKGLTILATVLEGDFVQKTKTREVEQVKKLLKDTMKEEKVRGFAKVMVTNDVTEGLNMFVQTVGLGGLKHNTVMIGWPDSWNNATNDHSWKVFLDTVRAVDVQGLALLVPRGIENFPDRRTILTGTIDVWWIIHDGGMLILLSFLLQKHKSWKGCRIRIFTVAHITDNSIQMKKNLETYLYQIRIAAEVHVIEMYDSAISAYTVERTLDMEKRTKLLKEFKRSDAAKLSATSDYHVHHSISSATSPEEVLALTRRSSESLVRPLQRNNSSVARFPCLPRVENGDTSSPFSSATNVVAVDQPVAADDGVFTNKVHFTFSASDKRAFHLSEVVRQKLSLAPTNDSESETEINTDSHGCLLRMHTAVQLNQTIRSKSSEAQIVIVNFPEPPVKQLAQENYMEYLEVLTDGLDRVLMVRGSGKEVVTMYS